MEKVRYLPSFGPLVATHGALTCSAVAVKVVRDTTWLWLRRRCLALSGAAGLSEDSLLNFLHGCSNREASLPRGCSRIDRIYQLYLRRLSSVGMMLSNDLTRL